MSIKKSILLLCLVFMTTSVYAFIFDNRFFPLFQRPYITADYRPSHYLAEVFLTTADRAYGLNGEDIPLGALFGPYELQNLGQSLVTIGKTNPLNVPPFIGQELPWVVGQKIQSQGFDFAFEQAITRWLWVGGFFQFLRVNSCQTFTFEKSNSLGTSPCQNQQIDDLRREIHDELGLSGEHSKQSGFNDIELYARFGYEWDYVYKFRHIRAGFRLGTQIPTGCVRDIDSPSSVPFGGNGHWGFEAAADLELEVKEDWKVGAFLYTCKRASRCCLERIPIDKEPQIFGAIVAPVKIQVGATFAATPYVSFENLRDGLAVRILYTLRYHAHDRWTDLRSDKSIPSNLEEMCKQTRWGSDYITLNAFYDFGKTKPVRGFDPIVSLAWDIPASLLITKFVAKTYRVCLGVEFNF